METEPELESEPVNDFIDENESLKAHIEALKQSASRDRAEAILEKMSDTLEKLETHMNNETTPSSPRSDTSATSTGLFGSTPHHKRDFDRLVYEEDVEADLCSKCSTGLSICDEDEEHCWSRHKKHRLHRCLWKLKYNRIVSSFYLDSLRQREERWSWMIVLISTLTSGFTVANNVETTPFESYNLIVNVVLTASSMTTSLIAAWIKKQRFVEKINEIDKYLVDLNKLCEELELQFSLLEGDRLSYKQFKETYLPQITKFVSTNPMIPPNEWKNAVREITLRYPELIDPDNSETNKLWPWFGDLVVYVDKEGVEHNVRKPTTFMKYMKRTNKDRILSSCCRKKRDSHNVYK